MALERPKMSKIKDSIQSPLFSILMYQLLTQSDKTLNNLDFHKKKHNMSFWKANAEAYVYVVHKRPKELPKSTRVEPLLV